MALLDREYEVSAMSLFCTVSVILRDILGGNRVFYTRHDWLAIIITDVVKLRGIIRRSCWAHTLGTVLIDGGMNHTYPWSDSVKFHSCIYKKPSCR